MTAFGWFQILLALGLVLASAKPLGDYMHAAFEGRLRFLAPVERALLRAAGVDPARETGWSGYLAALLAFNAAGFVTNTNRPSYRGEATMSHLARMAGVAAQNFLSAATGIAVLLARGFARTDTQYLRVYVRQLREKLGDDPAAPRFILTEPGVGYRFVVAV